MSTDLIDTAASAAELARDCWMALSALRHPSAHGAETPEWLAASAACLPPVQLPPALAIVR